MFDIDPEGDQNVYGKKSGMPVNIYATREVCAILRKFKNRSWLANAGVRLVSAEISGYVKLDDTLRRTGPDSRYDEKQDRRLQFVSDTVDIRYRMAQLNNPKFFGHPNQRFVETELEELRAGLYDGAKFHKKPHRKKHSAVASIYGLLVLLVIVGTVCASYLYASSLPLPDLEQYHVLVPVVLSSPFLLISSSLRAICRKALGTLRQKLT